MTQLTETTTRTWVVAQSHPEANDTQHGTPEAPFRTIGAAAAKAQPGDTVLIHAGVYRERIAPAHGGEPDRPITYAAAPGQKVYVRGSEPFAPPWTEARGMPGVLRGTLEAVTFGIEAYGGLCDPAHYATHNPYLRNFNRGIVARPHREVIAQMQQRVDEARGRITEAEHQTVAEQGFLTDARRRLRMIEEELATFTREKHRRYRTTLGQVFIDGVPMREIDTLEELARVPGTWMVDPDGEAILLHPPAGVRDPLEHLVELSVRHTIFAPLKRGLGYITVRGLILEHAANHFPTWGKGAWAQAGALSCRSGHHWIIEDCVIRHAKGLGIDCGSEGGRESMEFPPHETVEDHARLRDTARHVGHHLIRRNHISDHGHCGIAGIGHYGTQVIGNVIERNNADGWTSPWWEFAAIKFHHFYDGLIEGNLIRDNDTHGIWLDNQWAGSRVTRNVIVNNLWSGINVELGRGPVLIDHNVIAHTRQGDGIYGHDVADVTIAHNLLYANANYGIWFAFATPRVKPEDGCWDIKSFNNLILGNRAGAIGYPLPWDAAGNNVSDGNLLMGGGEYLDEGSGPQDPLFQITSVSHMAPMQPHLKFPAMTDERLRVQMAELLDKAGIPPQERPNLEQWTGHYLLNLKLWQAVSGNDTHSKITRTIRDGFGARRLMFQFRFDEVIGEVGCDRIAGIEHDYFGTPLPTTGLLPGPFQHIQPREITSVTVWPVPGIEGPRNL